MNCNDKVLGTEGNDKDDIEIFSELFGLIYCFYMRKGLLDFACLVVHFNSSPSWILSELVHLVDRIAKNRSPLISHDSFKSDSVPS